MTRGILAFCALAVFAVVSLPAQCPDGTPPPCAAPRPASAPNSVAVLVFENRARDTSLTLLAEGLADEITTNLGRVRRLEVRSQASVHYALARGSREPRRIGRALTAHWLVDGQILPGRGGVRVNVELLEASRAAVRWSNTYQRPTEDLLGLVRSVAESVATAIVGELAPDERPSLVGRPTTNSAAYDLYLRGRASLRQGAAQNLLVARALLEEAFRLDTTFVDAAASLASTWVSIADNLLAPREAYPQARDWADRALRRDPSSAEATAALAKIALFYDWDVPGAVLVGRRAVALAPASAEARLALGLALIARDEADEGARQLLAAADRDSLSERTLNNVSMGLQLAGHFDDMLALGRRLEGVAESRGRGIRMQNNALEGLGRCEEAAALRARARHMAVGMDLCPRPDEPSEAELDSTASALRRTSPYFRAWALAGTYAVIGAQTKALKMLEQAFGDREAWMPFLGRDPHFTTLRTLPAFIDLQRRVAAAGRE